MNAPEPAQRSTPLPSGDSVASHPAADTQPPLVPDYYLLRRIGGGAYGEVWLARSKATGKLRAAKIVWRRTFEDDRPFQREFEGIQHFEQISREHPSQLALFHIGRNEAEGYFYYVMELADDNVGQASSLPVQQASALADQNGKLEASPPAGKMPALHYTPHTLRADLVQGRLAAARVLEIGLALTEALSHLHSNGLVHRDVKPSNVIFVNGRPKLADIGLVTDASDQCSIVGTEGYLPPEGPGTPQADIFALGKVLYEAATGLDRREFPKLPNDLRAWPDARQVFELNEVFIKACNADPRQRYATADAMLSELVLLRKGESVKRRRAQQWYWIAAKRTVIALVGIGVLAASIRGLMRESAPADPFPDGPDSTNFLANADCDKGLAIIRNDNYEQHAEAYAYFTNAIFLDQHFARPSVGLLEMALRDARTFWNAKEAEAMRREAAARLKELKPDLGATYTAQAINAFYDWDFPAAEQFARLAIKASPRYELGYTWYGYMLSQWQRPNEARSKLEISQKLARSKAIVYRCIGHTYYAQRDFKRAMEYYQQAIAVGRHQPLDFNWLGRAQRALGDYQSCLDNMERGELLYATNVAAINQRYQALHQALTSGTNAYWQCVWKLNLGKTNNFIEQALIQIHLGNPDAALDLLEKAVANKQGRGREGGLNYLLFDESWDCLRDEPRFTNILDQIGYTKVMRTRKE